ncbi:hypothetical protein HF086_017570 [Spodoptera exigua]|uniref:NR LBD domain-containing protein n=1 Tax=Spodoptera exigua TaxID=7107 RepID=A0A922MKN8_SPOEX|nr:hypothetical protein HF086_017570 [Spodoptera exigua]
MYLLILVFTRQRLEAGGAGILSTAESVQLSVSLPGAAPPHLRLHAVCEAGARLLAAAARWLRAVPAAHALPYVRGAGEPAEEVLAGAVRAVPVAVLGAAVAGRAAAAAGGPPAGRAAGPRRHARARHLARHGRARASDYSDERIAEVTSSLSRLQQFISHMEQLRLQQREHAHLRALCLFSPDGVPDFLTRKLQDYQIKVLRSLRATVQDEDRLATLLLQLPVLRTFSGPFLEDVFFVGFVGDVSIDDVIPYLLNAER